MVEKDLYNKLIFGKYKIISLIGKGSFGCAYKGVNILNKINVAIKTEKWKTKGNLLESEAYILYHLKGFGIPEVKSFGIFGKYKILVENLLGDSLENIFNNLHYQFTLKDICMIAIQLIDRFEYIHSKYIIHRDIKPDNILVDYETSKIIHLIDFGLSKKYRSSRTGKHIKFNIPKKMTGTARFASRNALCGKEQSRRDDLESIGYVLIYFGKKGILPWHGLRAKNKLERYIQIYYYKNTMEPKDLCSGLPNEFSEFLTYTKNLKFEEKPDYKYLKGLFINILNRYNYKNDLNFSWIKNTKKKRKSKKNCDINNNNNMNINLTKRRESPQSRLYRNILNSSSEKKDNIYKSKIINKSEEIKEEKNNNNILLLKNQSEKILNKDMIEDDKKNENKNEIDLKNIINNEKFAKKDFSFNNSEKNISQISQFEISIDIEDEKIENNNKNNNNNNDGVLNYNSKKEIKEEKEEIEDKNELNKIILSQNNNKEKIIKRNDFNNNYKIPILFNTDTDSFRNIITNYNNISNNNMEKDTKKINKQKNKDTNSYSYNNKNEKTNLNNIDSLKNNIEKKNIIKITNNLNNSKIYNSYISRNINPSNSQKIMNFYSYDSNNLNDKNRFNLKINLTQNNFYSKLHNNIRKINKSKQELISPNFKLNLGEDNSFDLIKQKSKNENYTFPKNNNIFKNKNNLFQIPKKVDKTNHYYTSRNRNINNIIITENQQDIDIYKRSYQIPMKLVKSQKILFQNKSPPNYINKQKHYLLNVPLRKESKGFNSFDNIIWKNPNENIFNIYKRNNSNKNMSNIRIKNKFIDRDNVNVNDTYNNCNQIRLIKARRQLSPPTKKIIRINKNSNNNNNKITIKKQLFYNKLCNDNIYTSRYINSNINKSNFINKNPIKKEKYNQFNTLKFSYSNNNILNEGIKNQFIQNNNLYKPYNIRKNRYNEYNNNFNYYLNK